MYDRRIFDRLDTLYASGHVKRLHTLPTLAEHTVGHHVYGSMLVAMELCKLEQVTERERLSVLTALLYHDAPEVATGDVPAPTKRASPAIAAGLERMEETFYARWEVAMPTHTELSQRARDIVSAADTIDLWFNCIHEARLGNRWPALGNSVVNNCYIYLSASPLESVQMFREHLKEVWENVG